MAPFRREEQAKTLSRLRGAIKIKVGPDITDILGLDPGITDIAQAGGGVVTKLLAGSQSEVGTIDTLDLVQSREVTARYAFGPNPQQAFQVVPRNHKVTLRASRIVLKTTQQCEQAFNFLPSNLVFQQLPFVIQIDDIGDPARPESRITHLFYGCWFTASTIKYDVTSVDDQRLIQNVDITCARVFTLDNTNAGSPGAAIARASFSGVQSIESAQNVLENFPLN